MNEIMDGQLGLFDLDTWCGKTYPEHSVQTEDEISKPSDRKSSKLSAQKLPMFLCLIGGGWSKAGCLNGMGKNGIPFSVAWRLHDAQYFGVPQRRKRICVLADFNGNTAAEILFDPKFERTTQGCEPVSSVGNFGGESGGEIQTLSESVSRDSEPSGKARERAAAGVESGADSAICLQGNGIDRSDTAGCNGCGWRRGGVTPLTQSTAQPLSVSKNEQVNQGGVKEYSSNMNSASKVME